MKAKVKMMSHVHLSALQALSLAMAMAFCVWPYSARAWEPMLKTEPLCRIPATIYFEKGRPPLIRSDREDRISLLRYDSARAVYSTLPRRGAGAELPLGTLVFEWKPRAARLEIFLSGLSFECGLSAP